MPPAPPVPPAPPLPPAPPAELDKLEELALPPPAELDELEELAPPPPAELVVLEPPSPPPALVEVASVVEPVVVTEDELVLPPVPGFTPTGSREHAKVVETTANETNERRMRAGYPPSRPATQPRTMEPRKAFFRSCGDMVGRPRSLRAPFFTRISSRAGPSACASLASAASSSAASVATKASR